MVSPAGQDVRNLGHHLLWGGNILFTRLCLTVWRGPGDTGRAGNECVCVSSNRLCGMAAILESRINFVVILIVCLRFLRDFHLITVVFNSKLCNFSNIEKNC